MKKMKFWSALILAFIVLSVQAENNKSLGLLRKNLVIDARKVTPKLELGLAHKTEQCRYVLLNDEAYLEVQLKGDHQVNVFTLRGHERDAFIECLSRCDTLSDVRLVNYEFNNYVVNYTKQNAERRYKGARDPYLELVLRENNKRVITHFDYTEVKEYTRPNSSNDEGGAIAIVDDFEGDDVDTFKEVDEQETPKLEIGKWYSLGEQMNLPRFDICPKEKGITGVIGDNKNFLLFEYQTNTWRDRICQWVINQDWEALRREVVMAEINNPQASTMLYDIDGKFIGNYKECLLAQKRGNESKSFIDNIVSNESDSSENEVEQQDKKSSNSMLDKLLMLLILYGLYKVFFSKSKSSKDEDKRRKREEDEKKRKKRKREEDEDRQRRDYERRYAEGQYEDYLRQQREQRWD